MTEVAAIYGFEFTRPFDAAGLHFEPVSSDHASAKSLARTLDSYNLIGTVSAPSLTSDVLFRLEAVLSFVEHLDVRISHVVNDTEAVLRPHDYFEASAVGGRRNNGGGAVIGEDTFWREARPQFIELALKRLADQTYCQDTKFNSLFFKAVEVYRQRRPFLEISYFLLVSGLEAFARHSLKDFTSKNAATPVVKLLKGYGFRAFVEHPAEPARAISTFFHIRNALFHKGEFAATVQTNGSQATYGANEYFFNLSMLVSLTCVKAIGFDDGHINWDCWIDRQLHC
jgi:hypothetical protein